VRQWQLKGAGAGKDTAQNGLAGDCPESLKYGTKPISTYSCNINTKPFMQKSAYKCGLPKR
jgi:hypothetical protein